MTPIEIGKAYDQITSLWENESFNRLNGIEQYKKAISFSNTRGKVLDIGCGCTGRFIELLSKEGFLPEGLDISEKMLTLAREKHPKIKFHHQDICLWNSSHKYEFISAWDSFWHIPLTRQKDVLTKIVNALNPNGILIFSFGGTLNPEEHYDNAMGPELYFASLGINAYLSELITLGCTIRHLEFDQGNKGPHSHVYVIVQKTLFVGD